MTTRDKSLMERRKKETVHEAITQVQRLADLFHRRRAALAAQVGLTEKQWLVLERISNEHFMPSMFAKEQESSLAAVSKILRQLVDKQVVSVSLSETDSRKRDYQLTPAGRKMMSKLRILREAAIDQIWMAQDETALSVFCEFVTQLITSIEVFSDKEV